MSLIYFFILYETNIAFLWLNFLIMFYNWIFVCFKYFIG